MTDKELKRLISNAYTLSETESEKSFVRRNSKRSNQLLEIIKIEFRCMGICSLLAGALLYGVLFFASKTCDMKIMWIISSISPAGSLIPMLMLAKSERYGMDELEMTCRFSLSFIRMTRMAILGVISFFLIFMELFITVGSLYSNVLEIVMYMLIPYFACIWSGLSITRRYHGKKGIYGVVAANIMSAFLPSIIRNIQETEIVPGFVYAAVLAILTAAILREGKKYVKERNDLSWNLYLIE